MNDDEKYDKAEATILSKSKPKEICFIEDDAVRNGVWEMYYFGKYHRFASPQLQKTYETSWSHKKMQEINDMLKNEDSYKKLAKSAGQMAADAAYVNALNYLVAKEVVKSTVGGAVSASGRRAAVVAIEESSALLAAQAANVAKTKVISIATLPVGVASVVGEIAGDSLSYALGIENNHLKNVFSAGGATAAAAGVGACIGGPVGALAGAAVGASSWAIGKGITGLINSGLGIKGPNDNWCFIEIGDIGSKQLCFGTYAGNDTFYWHTYWKEYKSSNSDWIMSAGQGKKSSFQLTLWDDKSNVVKHWNNTYHRDRIRVCKNSNGWSYVVFCKGELHGKDAGKTELKKW